MYEAVRRVLTCQERVWQDFEPFRDAVIAFSDMIAQIEVAERKELPMLFEITDRVLKGELDRLMAGFKTSHAAFFLEYDRVRVPFRRGASKVGVVAGMNE
jgi:hypothetical protein